MCVHLYGVIRHPHFVLGDSDTNDARSRVNASPLPAVADPDP